METVKPPNGLTGVLQGPLKGLRVVDLSINVMGPLATQSLGDMGAEVIKIETPGGDPLRAEAREHELGPSFMSVNRNKKSVVLELREPEGLQALMKIVATADVFIHSMRPAAADRLGIGYEAIALSRPDIVYACGVGYRLDGPYGEKPAYDNVIQGESGLVDLCFKASGEMSYLPTIMADKVCALVLSQAITHALIHRQRTGEGQYVTVPMLETTAAFNLVEHIWAGSFGREGPWCYPRLLTRHRRPFPTRDGYVCLLALTDDEWRRLWEAVGQAEVAVDPRFVNLAARTRNIDTLYGLLGEAFVSFTTEDAIRRLRVAGIACGAVNTIESLQDDPHLAAIGFFKTYEHPASGCVVTTDVPVQMSRTPGAVALPPPRLGEHSQTILASVGYGEGEIARLAQARLTGTKEH